MRQQKKNNIIQKKTIYDIYVLYAIDVKDKRNQIIL